MKEKTRFMMLQRRRGYSLMELIVGLMLVGIALTLLVPKGTATRDNATTKVAAEELVARFRQARQTAITKSVPVGVAFPTTPSMYHTDQAYFLEGEVNPRVTEQWKIQQSKTEVVYFSGTWSGPNWAPGTVLNTASKAFDPAKWFGTAAPPNASIFIFTPSGNVVSQSQAADGKFRVVVGMGVSSGGSSTLVAVNSPYTVWLSPSGEVGLEKGVYGGNVLETGNKDSSPAATFTAPPVAANRPPVVQIVPPATSVGPKAYPNNINPKTNNGNMIDLDAVLTLEVRVKDDDGDPPYFRWETTEAAEFDDEDETFTDQSDMVVWGGRFSNTAEVRMEWDAETQEWVGRDTWAPATVDRGGNRYKLVCKIRDRKGGSTTTGFPVDGNYLVTSKEPWVLYKTWNAANRAELWKMTLDGLEHTRVVSFGYQDVDFGQWSPSGVEIIVGAADGVYRVTADGSNLSKMGSVNLGGPIDGCCLAPAGDALYYIGGPDWNKKIRKVYFDPNTGNPTDVPLGGGGSVGVKDTHDLSAAQYGNKVVLMSSFYWNNTSSLFGTGLFKKKKKRSGGLVIDAGLGTANLPPAEPSGPSAEGAKSGTKSAWAGRGADNNNKSYGISLNYTTDATVQANVHVLYGSGNGWIHAVSTNFTSPFDVGSNFVPGPNIPGYPKDTGIGDVHHPKYASSDRTDLIFVAGRGTASRLYYWPKLGQKSSIRQLPLHPLNRGADQPCVSRPRFNF
jgi:prepilin-type N-terminal cleavage/methylation domain-containing protein